MFLFKRNFIWLERNRTFEKEKKSPKKNNERKTKKQKKEKEKNTPRGRADFDF